MGKLTINGHVHGFHPPFLPRLLLLLTEELVQGTSRVKLQQGHRMTPDVGLVGDGQAQPEPVPKKPWKIWGQTGQP